MNWRNRDDRKDSSELANRLGPENRLVLGLMMFFAAPLASLGLVGTACALILWPDTRKQSETWIGLLLFGLLSAIVVRAWRRGRSHPERREVGGWSVRMAPFTTLAGVVVAIGVVIAARSSDRHFRLEMERDKCHDVIGYGNDAGMPGCLRVERSCETRIDAAPRVIPPPFAKLQQLPSDARTAAMFGNNRDRAVLWCVYEHTKGSPSAVYGRPLPAKDTRPAVTRTE